MTDITRISGPFGAMLVLRQKLREAKASAELAVGHCDIITAALQDASEVPGIDAGLNIPLLTAGSRAVYHRLRWALSDELDELIGLCAEVEAQTSAMELRVWRVTAERNELLQAAPQQAAGLRLGELERELDALTKER